MAEKKVNIKITADSKNAEKGINGVTSSINKLNKSVKTSSFAKLKTSVMGTIGVISGAVAGMVKLGKAVVDHIRETTELYQKQANAEKALQTVAKNNPYFNSQGVGALKKFASELQKVSNYGDEYLMPLMTELVASGRSQEEVMKIMQAAADISSTGLISMESAVQSLNKSLEGEVGALGRVLPNLKNLTKEELASGKAIDIVQKSFNGLAKETADSYTQMKNAQGDYEEFLGKSNKRIYDSWYKWRQKRYEKQLEDLKNWEMALGAEEGTDQYKANEKLYSKLRNKMDKEQLAVLAQLDEDSLRNLQYYLINSEETQGTSHAKKTLKLIGGLDAYKKQLEEEEKLKKESEEKKAADAKAIQEAQAKRDKLRAEYDASVQKVKDEIEQKRILGEKIDEETEAQLLLNAATNAYIKMMSDPAFAGNSGNFEHEVNAREDIANWQSKLSASNLKDAFLKNYGDNSVSEYDEIKNEISKLDQEYNAVIDLTELSESEKYAIREAWINKTQELYKQLSEVEKNETIETVESVMNTINNINSNLSNTLSSIGELATTNAENQATVRTAALEKEYSEGLISEEEYYEQKEKIEKDAAKKQYKIQMAQWALQVAQATSNIAQGVTKAIADGGTMGLITGALVSAAGAAQLATIIANKPVQSFATGGIVSGASYSGDRVRANVNSGEMILNARQQMQLWKTANGQGANGGLNVQVKNYMGNAANVTTELNGNNLLLVIDKRINQQLSNGSYGEALTSAQNLQNGINYQS